MQKRQSNLHKNLKLVKESLEYNPDSKIYALYSTALLVILFWYPANL
jgi:hypothetical protein